MKKDKLIIGIMMLISIALIAGIVSLNKSNKDSAIQDNIEYENMDIEKEKVRIPEIKENEVIDNPENEELDDEVENQNDIDKEEPKKVEDNKTKINSISKPDKVKLPEEMEKPITEPKPKEPPKPVDEKINDKSKPPTTKEEPNQDVKGGTDSDGVVKDLKGNPTGLKPAENVEEIKGSELLPDGKKAGEGDKF